MNQASQQRKKKSGKKSKRQGGTPNKKFNSPQGKKYNSAAEAIAATGDRAAGLDLDIPTEMISGLSEDLYGKSSREVVDLDMLAIVDGQLQLVQPQTARKTGVQRLRQTEKQQEDATPKRPRGAVNSSPALDDTPIKLPTTTYIDSSSKPEAADSAKRNR